MAFFFLSQSQEDLGWEGYFAFKNTTHKHVNRSGLISSLSFLFQDRAPGEHGEKYMPNMTNFLDPKFLMMKPVIIRCRCTRRYHKKSFLKSAHESPVKV